MPQTHTAVDSECLIYTFKEGLLSAAAHDLKLKVKSFEIEVAEDSASVQARFNSRSIEVISAMKNSEELPSLLSDKDKQQIHQNMTRDVLLCDRFPEITFRSSEVVRHPGRVSITGELQIRDHRRAVTIHAEEKNGRLVAELNLLQPDFGIRPFSAMFGTIKLKPEVRIVLSLPNFRVHNPARA